MKHSLLRALNLLLVFWVLALIEAFRGGLPLPPLSSAASSTFTPASEYTLHLPLVLKGRHTPPAWSEINDFLYQLQNLNLEAIGDTAFDLVIMDYSASGGDSDAFTAAQIAALQDSPGGPKRALAYMSIGEAENYRWYWDPAWDADEDGLPDPGASPWLDQANPAWPDNYKVRYWHSGWQDIIFGSPDSYLDKILAAGYDGAYLDLVDAYEYYEDQGRTTAAQEMVDFVKAIAAYARARRPDFAVFVQNGAELATNFSDYLSTITALAQEDIYYGHEGEDQPTPPEQTAYLESLLDVVYGAGKLVLTVDYASTPAYVDDAYARSQARGYVPYVTVRSLDRLIIHPGHEPD